MHGSKTPDSRLVAFGGGRLDRVDHVRSNPLLLAEAFASPLARRIVLEGLEPVVEGGHLVMEPLPGDRSEEHTSELQSLMRISYAVFCLKKKKKKKHTKNAASILK